ncbi:MAG: hypothetical protein ACKOHM_12030 [Spartobacteria bacterium]
MKDDLAENDELWSLLGHARKTTPSPFFARNVLRSVRNLSPAPTIPRFFLPWLQAAALSILLLGFTLSLIHPQKSQVPPELVEYFDIAAGLDQFALADDLSLNHLANSSL